MCELRNSDTLKPTKRSHFYWEAIDIVTNQYATHEGHPDFDRLVGRVAGYLTYLSSLPNHAKETLGHAIIDRHSLEEFFK